MPHRHPLDENHYCDECGYYPTTKAEWRRQERDARKGRRRRRIAKAKLRFLPWENYRQQIKTLEAEKRGVESANQGAASMLGTLMNHLPPVKGHDFDLIDRLRRANAQEWSDAEILALVRQHPAANAEHWPWPR